MKSQFSETQFSFAILKEFIQKHPNSKFFLPSQQKEFELGFDAKTYSAKGIPIFYQFKTSEFVGKLGKEYSSIGEDYFRFHTYPGDSNYNQHNVLMLLSVSFNRVFYVAPCFYLNSDFDKYFLSNSISGHSRFIKVKRLKTISDNDSHSICFVSSKTEVWMFSEPFKVTDSCYSDEYAFDNKLDDFVTLEELINTIKPIFGVANNFSISFKEIVNRLYKSGIILMWFIPERR